MSIGPINEFSGKTIKRLELYSDVLLIEFDDGKTQARAFVEPEDGNRMRIEVRQLGPKGAPPAIRVHLGDVRCPYVSSDES